MVHPKLISESRVDTYIKRSFFPNDDLLEHIIDTSLELFSHIGSQNSKKFVYFILQVLRLQA